jgi:hypothetical protein
MGRKREKGKARKAKAAAAAQHATGITQLRVLAQHAMVGSQEWRIWAMVDPTQGCNHRCPFLPAPDHVVSLFMDALWDRSGVPKTPDSRFILDKFDNHGQVWDNSTLRKMSLDILLAIGTNFILDADDHGIKLARRLTITIAVLEQYNGNGTKDLHIAMCKASLVADDTCWGGDREIIRFFLKRISCTCLKAKYSLVKKLQPTRTSGCVICNQAKVRSSMMLCGRCKLKQYCSKDCQAADWPNHKGLCRSIHEQIMKCA